MPPAGLRVLRAVSAALALLLGCRPARVAAQDPTWNTPDALALIARARLVRAADAVDPQRRAYQALATGHVFFLVDRPDSDRRTLIKADQVAIEVYWKAPRATRQRIVGMRDQKVLPTNIRYHLDHLTVVQDDFGDVIRIGDGDEVSAVLHPAAPASDAAYDFALGDSLSIAFPGGGEVRVQEIRVRPKALDRPGYVGSLFVDRGSGAIVRMSFTFTPSSYVDAYLDYIRISLDNSLWEGRWWLPYQQEIEIRRELPQLDFQVGSVIRGRFDITDYQLNPDLADALFQGPRVTAVAPAQRQSYPFTEPLVPPVDSRDLTPTPSLQEIRAQALALTRKRYLSGLARLRPLLPSVSSVLRWNRAEGTFVGAGAAWHPTGASTVRGGGGWAFGAGRPELELTLENAGGSFGLRGAWNRVRDLGPFPGAYGAVNTLSAVFAHDDWLDPWLSSGIEAFFASRSPTLRTEVRLLAERHDSAATALDAEDAAKFRPIVPIAEGELTAVEGRAALDLPRALSLGATLRLASFDRAGPTAPQRYVVALGSVAWEEGRVGPALHLDGRLDGGLASGGGPVPEQERFHLGGRGTLPGHPYRAAVGRAFWLARAEAARGVLWPWLAARGFAGAGGVGLRDLPEPGASRRRPPAWDVDASAGVGAGLLWDVLHVDMARGLDGGEWELVVSVDRRFRGWL